MQDKEEKVVHKSVGPILVAQLRIHGTIKDLPDAFSKLDSATGNLSIGPPIVIHHWGVSDENGHDMDVCFPVSEPIEDKNITSATLPAKEAMTMIHRGPYSDIGSSYQKVSKHTSERGHPIAESTREVYHQLDLDNPEKTVIEIQTVLHDWAQRYAAKLETVLGTKVKEEVLAPLSDLNIDSPVGVRQRALCDSIGILETYTDDDQQYEILSYCAHIFPVELIPAMRELFIETDSIDIVIDAMLKIGGYYPKKMRREGSIIYSEKSPANPAAFKAAKTDAEKRRAYCFCPLIRDCLDETPEAFCNCSAGWPKQLWEGILDQPLKIEIVQSLTKGDDRCEFAIHLPPGVS
ncbi:MAG: GyrI-like domain-containing protein [Candidatus Thorarchaeota archaeon]